MEHRGQRGHERTNGSESRDRASERSISRASSEIQPGSAQGSAVFSSQALAAFPARCQHSLSCPRLQPALLQGSNCTTAPSPAWEGEQNRFGDTGATPSHH